MVNVPDATVQVGCVGVTDGAAGVAGCAFKVTLVTDEMQPAAFFAVTVWGEPAVKPLYTNVAEYAPKSKL